MARKQTEDVVEMTIETTTELEKAELRKVREETRKLKLETRAARIALAELEHEHATNNAEGMRHHLLPFWGAVSDSSAGMAIKVLGQWFRRNPEQPITITFNSPGGSVIAGLALYDFIQELRAHGATVDTVTLGYAASMGAVLLQAGERRIAGANSFLLIHEVSSISGGKVSELEDELAFTKRLQERLLAILAERSTLSKKQIAARWVRKDWWLSAPEALELGFVDEVRGL